MSRKAKIKMIQNIEKEKYFREEVLRILLMKMKYKGIMVTHGPGEHGKDVVFYEIDEKTGTETNYAIVAKLGKLKAGSNTDQNNIENVHGQVMRAFKVPYDDPERKEAVHIHRVWVVTNNTISSHAAKEIINFFGDKRDYYERNVEFFPDTRLCALLEDHWEDFFLEADPFLIHYSRNIETRCQQLRELKSFGYSKQLKKLVDVYIEPTFIQKRIKTKGARKKKLKSKEQRRPFSLCSPEEMLLGKNDVWLLGQPGSGKSTTIRNMILKLTGKIIKELVFDRVPVLLHFKDLIQNEKPASIKQTIIDTLNAENTLGFDINPAEWLDTGKMVLFVDGLDEIPSSKLREMSIENIVAFKQKFPRVKIVAACRDIGFEELRPRLKNFSIIDIYPFDFRQMKMFINKWFGADESSKEKMLEAVKASILSGNLPKTPMVLTLLAILFEKNIHQELPANLTELFSMFTQLFLGRWDIEKGIEPLFEYSIKNNILQELAYEMHVKGADGIQTEGLIKFISDYSDERRMGIDAETMINDVEQRSGLMAPINDIYSFKHLSFQEFFTSQHLVRQRNIDEKLPHWVLDPWWENVVFFYVGTMKDTPELFETIIRKSKPANEHEELKKYLNMGQLLQAGYLTAHKKKVEVLDFVLTHYYDLKEKIWKKVKANKDIKVGEFFFNLVIKEMFSQNYASTTLKEAMLEIFTRTWKTPVVTDEKRDMSEKDIFNSYLLAYSLALLELYDHLEDVASHPTIIDPIILALVDLDLSWLETEYGHTFDKKIVNKIRKRIKSSKKIILKALE